jgi:hypothetical protein
MYKGLFWAEQWLDPYMHIWTESEQNFTYYRGFFKRGKKNGIGLEMNGADTKYFGLFKENFRHGMGIYEGCYGDKYFGQYDWGHRHGEGLAVY